MALELVRTLSTQIQSIDTAVQEKFEQDAGTGNIKSFLYDIGYIVLGPNNLKIRYWGEIVNIEWEAELNLTSSGVYVPSNF